MWRPELVNGVGSDGNWQVALFGEWTFEEGGLVLTEIPRWSEEKFEERRGEDYSKQVEMATMVVLWLEWERNATSKWRKNGRMLQQQHCQVIL
jgi:hypothetical protein